MRRASFRPKAWFLLFAIPCAAPLLVAVVSPPQSSSVFHSGTRLVEVEVIVRGPQPPRPPGFLSFLKSALDSGAPFGPPGPLIQGLTRDDFLLFDEGKTQPISLFRAGSSAGEPAPLPPGAVSNRFDSRGQPLTGATVVLIDYLNTDFEMTDYERTGMTNLLRSIGASGQRVAIYSLGETLHMLHDFIDDPAHLLQLAANLDQPRRDRPRDLQSALADYGDLMALEGGREAARQAHAQITTRSIARVLEHLSGVPVRKNLVWLMSAGYQIPPRVISMLRQSSVVLYPVVVRCPETNILICQQQAADLAHATGGRPFFDAMDLTFAVHTAEEDQDARSAYILGFYPYEDQLDGRFHRLTVKLKDADLAKSYEVRYRTGYLATKVALPPPAPELSDRALLSDPLAATQIGLTARLEPDPSHAGMRQLQLTVDLHDIRLNTDAEHTTGGLDLIVYMPATNAGLSQRISVDFPARLLGNVLESGYSITAAGIGSQGGELHVVVRDHNSSAAGSLRLPVPAQ